LKKILAIVIAGAFALALILSSARAQPFYNRNSGINVVV
jgi:hypothetical protein